MATVSSNKIKSAVKSAVKSAMAGTVTDTVYRAKKIKSEPVVAFERKCRPIKPNRKRQVRKGK